MNLKSVPCFVFLSCLPAYKTAGIQLEAHILCSQLYLLYKVVPSLYGHTQYSSIARCEIGLILMQLSSFLDFRIYFLQKCA